MPSPPEPGSEGATGRARQRHGGELLTAISNAMVTVHRQQFGRGPSEAKSFQLDGMVLCLLRDVFTPVERTLISIGNEDSVRETRFIHQRAAEAEYIRPIVELTGRPVAAFISTVSFHPDMAIELFILGPEAGDGS
jgi:uncharacterized protein YbcI